ncbi:MFS transporter [Corynebacterium sp. Q4381]|uniref:MFS transporter n=1 Tax=Corynebacterium sp. Marseille-Q4381 TaxID=3121597 RepID=UPI002FE68EF7
MSSFEPTSKSQRWTFFAVISLGLFMISLDNSILYTALPELNRQLGTTPAESLWIINAYPLVLSGLLLGAGTLGDKIGHRLMFIVGLAVFGAASLAAAFAPSAWALVAARAALGVGAAAMMPATLALIRLTFADEQERNTAIGIWSSVAVVGAAVGPLIGGALLSAFWWGSIFLINVPIVVVALVLTLLLAPENVPNPDKHWDAVSSVYVLVALSGFTIAVKEAAKAERWWWLLAAAVAVTVTAGALFGRRQRLLTEPLLTFDIFRSRLFVGGVVAAAGAMFVLIGVELNTTQKLQLVDALSPLQAGLIIIVMALAAFPASALGGANLHRVGFLPLIAGGFFGAAAGTLLLAAGAQFAGLAVMGVSAGAIMSVSSIAIIGAAPPHRSGMAAGVEEVSYELGALLSVAVTGSLMGRWLETQTYMEAYGGVMVVLAVASASMGLLSLWCFAGNPKSGDLHP